MGGVVSLVLGPFGVGGMGNIMVPGSFRGEDGVGSGDILERVGIPGDEYPVLTPSDGQKNTYGWQAGGTHPTGMLSCSIL